MNNKRYCDAMAETLYYFRGIDIEDIKKIPIKLLKYLKTNASKDYVCNFDYTKPLKDLNLSKEAKALIGMICINYMYDNESDKEKIISKLKENDKLFYEQQRQKYNTDNMFSNSNKHNEEKINNVLSLEIKKQSLYDKIMEKLKRIFKKR